MALIAFFFGCVVDAVWQIARGFLMAIGAVAYLQYIGLI